MDGGRFDVEFENKWFTSVAPGASVPTDRRSFVTSPKTILENQSNDNFFDPGIKFSNGKINPNYYLIP